jgi:hypothetical protein
MHPTPPPVVTRTFAVFFKPFWVVIGDALGGLFH